MSDSDSPSVLPGIPGFDPDNLQPWTLATVVSVTVLSTVSIGMRLYARYLRAQKLWWDDWMIIFSQLWNYVTVGFIFAMYGAGMGIHADKVPMDDIVRMAKFLVVAEILYVFNLVWTKMAILFMYYRIFRFPYFKKMAWCISAFIIAWVITITFLFIFICVPVEKLWYPHLPGKCINQVGTWISNAISTILSDIAILVLPIPQVWKLQLRQSEKIGVTVAFCLGFFVVFASAYRTSVLFTYTNDDPSYSLAPTVGWTAIEMSAGIISANLPTLGPIMSLVLTKIGISSSLISNNSRSASKNGFSSKNNFGASGSGGNPKSTGSVTDHTEPEVRKDGDRAFYRLPDDQNSSDTALESRTATMTRDDSGLRPDHGYAYTVTSRPGRQGGDEQSLCGDEVPLKGIRVHTDFKQSAA
ncbi:hypothetical protein QBC40DRAFT_264379 [Triangularia verruculosa]|uniref:Rhodopsin domain-containing protein n=1 Tax=Triangularia verruculosa TaxID=2587418 RepID=A0AAN6XME3_9PEZI|nr:hypothetical protein QBC40DRAFT_264379 [Triangularia verruculosa]